jgi:hypothetical protein
MIEVCMRPAFMCCRGGTSVIEIVYLDAFADGFHGSCRKIFAGA